MDWSISISIISGLVAISGAVVAIVNARHSARKSTVDRQSTIIDNLNQEYSRLCKENELLRAKLSDISAKFSELTRKYDTLEWQYRHVCLWAREKGYQLPPPPPPGNGQA